MKQLTKLQQLFWYFVIFSIIGLLLETIFCYITTGVLESRKGLIWGPFCPVYGVGAVVLIILLDQVDQRNYFKLFLYGFLIGAVVEYILSYGLEAIYGTRFWDYSYTGKDINGRICVLYSLFWGILAILLMKIIRPAIDKIMDRIPKINKTAQSLLFLFLIIDTLFTIWGIHIYETRTIHEFYQEEMQYSNISWIRKIEEDYFSNDRMEKTFPNLRTKDREGNQVFVRDLIKKVVS